MNYIDKYLKYKTKYLNLKLKLSTMNGSAIDINKTRELYTDEDWADNSTYDTPGKITAIKLESCLFILSFAKYYDDINDEIADKLVHAWHISGADLSILLDSRRRNMYISIGDTLSVNNADSKFEYWSSEYGKKHKIIIIGPNANSVVQSKFGGTVYKTVEGPVNVEYNLLTKQVTVTKTSDNKVIDSFTLPI
jgi:hypothetical protein